MRISLAPVATGTAMLTLALTPPALALGELTATEHYTCTTPSGDLHPAVRYSVDQPPATMIAGQTVRLPSTATVALDAATTQLVESQAGATSVAGTLTTSTTAARVGLDLVIAQTPLGNGADGVTNAPVTGTVLLRATSARPYVLRIGSLGDLALTGLDATGRVVGSVEFPTAGSLGSCSDDADAAALTNSANEAATVKVVKDRTTTTLAARYASATRGATGIATVRSHFGLRATGTVVFTLKRGTHLLATTRSALNGKGVAKATFSHVSRMGDYTIRGRYAGNSALRPSRGADTFRVGA